MRNLDIKINRAAITGFRVSLNEEGLPNVTVDIMLMTEQGKQVTTHQLSTNGWRKEDKFELPLVMIDPVKRIAAALEEVVVRHMNDGQALLGEGEVAPQRFEFEGDAIEAEIVDFHIEEEETETIEGVLDELDGLGLSDEAIDLAEGLGEDEMEELLANGEINEEDIPL